MNAVPLPRVLIETLTRVATQTHARGECLYLVGGLLRDQLLGRSLRYLNVDVIIERGALALSHALAEGLHGAFVLLDEAAGCARVVVGEGAARVELDISEFRGATLEEDLALRDFTVNAIAMPLTAWLREPAHPTQWIDPLHGREALKQKRLIACFPGTFTDDPVRILRAFRFATQLEFEIDSATVAYAKRVVAALAQVSGERIRDELMAIFETDHAAGAIRSLNELGALDVIFPELSLGRGMHQGGYHHLDVLGHQLEAVVQADRILQDFAEFSLPLQEVLATYCSTPMVERRTRKGLIKLASLLHDVGKPARRTVEPDGEIWFLGHEETGAALATEIVKRLRLSNREAEMVCQLVLHHLRPGFLSREPQLTRRAVYRFFKQLGEDGPGCLLTWWADRMATRGPMSRLDQLDQQRSRLEELFHAYFFQAAEVVKPPRLVDGRQLMTTFQLAPGPLIGQLLGAIEEAQAEGHIHSPEEALALAKARLDQPQAR